MDELIQQWRKAHGEAVMVGWDFSVLDGRLTTETEPWDFEADCLEAMQVTDSIIDLGTGGGERLIALADQLGHAQGKTIIATEGWEPNVEVARKNLAPHGIDVKFYDAETGGALPAGDDSADLIMSRHESIDASEIVRVLRPGGIFLTQQVDGYDAPELHEWFGADYLYPDVNLADYHKNLENAGLAIEVAEEWSGSMTFCDVEALVTYIGFVPWDVPEFSVERHRDVLLHLHKQGPITVTQKRFRIYAMK